MTSSQSVLKKPAHCECYWQKVYRSFLKWQHLHELETQNIQQKTQRQIQTLLADHQVLEEENQHLKARIRQMEDLQEGMITRIKELETKLSKKFIQAVLKNTDNEGLSPHQQADFNELGLNQRHETQIHKNDQFFTELQVFFPPPFF